MAKPREDYEGILFIGDPHLASRAYGLRKDDYQRVSLAKLDWCLTQADERGWLPALLGDLFDVPQQNANWLIGELIDLLRDRCVVGIYGNHDVSEGRLRGQDSLDLLVKARCVELVDLEHPWTGRICGKPLRLFGVSHGIPLPEAVPREQEALQILMSHHDLRYDGYISGRLDFCEIPGIDLVINGHLHQRYEDQSCGGTIWKNPGNITRLKRGDGSRNRKPSALLVQANDAGLTWSDVEIPHRPYEEVFYLEENPEEGVAGSEFVAGLQDLNRYTESGGGLDAFLEANLDAFELPVRNAILTLREKVRET